MQVGCRYACTTYGGLGSGVIVNSIQLLNFYLLDINKLFNSTLVMGNLGYGGFQI